MKKKKRQGAFFLTTILLVSMVIFGVVIGFAIHYNKTVPKYFVTSKEARGKKLYLEVMETDLEADYPMTPDEVMMLYNKISYIIYGGMLRGDELIDGLLMQQRYMYSEEILEANSFDDQRFALVSGLQVFNEADNMCLDITQEEARSDLKSPGVAVIRVIQVTNNLGDIYWDYYLDRPDGDGRWKIIKWQLVDQTGGPIL